MNLLIVDTDCTGVDLAYRAAEAGHSVRLWMAPNEDHSPVRDGDGFPGIEKVYSWKNHGAWAKSGLVVPLFNDRKVTAELDKWRAFGIPVFGPSVKSAELEWNRGKGMAFFEDHGIEVPHYETFKTLEEAIAFAWKAEQPYVFKTLGDEEQKDLTYVSSDPADMVGWLETKKAHGLKLKGPCMMQEKIDKIADVGISGWMGRDGFLPGRYTTNHEFKKLMPGNFGQNTGETGTVLQYIEGGKLFDSILAPLEEPLRKLGHIGDFDIECGIDSKGRIWPYECTARFGWPSTQIAMACHLGDPVQWMKDALRGKATLEVDNRVAIGVLMCQPPYPMKNEDPASSVGYVISGVEEVWEHVSPWQMMIEQGPVNTGGAPKKGPIYKTTGEYICVVTALGADVHDVVPQVFETVEKIKFPNRIVRNDVGKRLEQELPKLHALGFSELPNW